MLRAGLLVSQLRLMDYFSEHLGGGRAGGPAGSIPGTLGESVDCRRCRAKMCTDELLSKLRCAECRHIQFAQLFDVALRASLIAMGGLFTWLFVRRSQ